MKYFVYFRRSLTRAWREQLLFILMLTCTLALPLCVSLLQSSYTYGIEVYNDFVSGGHFGIIRYAQSGDEALFENLDGIIPVWEDGVLYLDRTADNPLTFDEQQSPEFYDISMSVTMAMYNVGRYDLYLECTEGSCMNAHANDFAPALHGAALLLTILTAGTVYAFFWNKKTADMRALSAIGASYRQIVLLSCAQFLFVQLSSSLLSLILVSGAFRLLTNRYLVMDWRAESIRMRSSGNWFVYHMDVRSVSMILICALAAGALIWYVWLMLYRFSDTKFMKRLRKCIQRDGLRRRVGSGRVTIRKILLRRQTLRICVYTLLAIPMLTGAVLLWQLCEPATDPATAPTDDSQGIRVFLYSQADIWSDSLDFLYDIEGVADIEYTGVPVAQYLILDDRASIRADGNDGRHAFVTDILQTML